MSTGLPTFATRYGGPMEIIEHGKSGFHLDPNHGESCAELMADFLERCRDDPEYWHTISNGAIDRVRSRYTWKLYAERMMPSGRTGRDDDLHTPCSTPSAQYPLKGRDTENSEILKSE